MFRSLSGHLITDFLDQSQWTVAFEHLYYSPDVCNDKWLQQSTIGRGPVAKQQNIALLQVFYTTLYSVQMVRSYSGDLITKWVAAVYDWSRSGRKTSIEGNDL